MNLKKNPAAYIIKPKQIVEIGPFKIEFIHVTHSIVSSVALAITTPIGVIIHTGDFKVDPTPTDNELFDLHTLAEYGKRGVLLLLSDSTNSDRPGYTESERAVRPRMEDIFNRAERRVVVSCFSSSIHRIQLVLDLAQEYGRKVAVVGRSMVSVTEIAHSLGLLEIPDGILLRPQDAMGLAPEKRRAWSPARRANPCRRSRAWPWTTTSTFRWKRATPWCSARASSPATKKPSSA